LTIRHVDIPFYCYEVFGDTSLLYNPGIIRRALDAFISSLKAFPEDWITPNACLVPKIIRPDGKMSIHFL